MKDLFVKTLIKLREKVVGETLWDKANNYINVLENKIKSLLEEKDKLLEENENLILENKILKKRLKSQKSLEQENKALKLLLQDLLRELEEERNKPPKIVKVVKREILKEPVVIEKENKDKDNEIKIKSLRDLKEAIKSLREESGINTYA